MKAQQNAELETDFLKANRGRYFCHACVGLNATTGVAAETVLSRLGDPRLHGLLTSRLVSVPLGPRLPLSVHPLGIDVSGPHPGDPLCWAPHEHPPERAFHK
jgi:hypothetical protein